MVELASTCRGCGTPVSSAANWCPACGTDLRSSVLVLDGGSDLQVGEVATRDRPVRWRVVGGVLLALAVVIGIASFTGGSDDPVDEDPSAIEVEPAGEEEPAGADDETGPTSSAAEEVEDEAPVDADEVETLLGGEAPENEVGDDPALVGPLVGEETGLDLLVTTETRTVRLSLDTGVVDELDIRAGQVDNGFGPSGGVLVVDDRLVTATSGVLEVRSLADPAAAAVRIPLSSTYGGGMPRLGPSSRDGHLWLLIEDYSDGPPPAFTLLEINLETGQTVIESTFEAILFFPPTLGPDGAVVWSPNGVKLMGREGVEDWPHGQSFVFGPGVALSMVCDDDLDCVTGFVDLETGDITPLEGRMLPWFGASPGSFSADGGLYVVFDWETSVVSVIDVRSGEQVHEVSVGQSGDEAIPVLSSDGRYLAWVRGNTVRLNRLGSDEVVMIDSETVGRLDSWSTSLVFVPAPG
ncbi:MAG: zinc ribbon domain-containing protein [Actinomycetia bacterium]|nr:zinc ribbon domain-containing protein [Actinomycetes bacterium]